MPLPDQLAEFLEVDVAARDERDDRVGVDAHDFAPIPFSVIDTWIQSLPGIETRLQTAIREARGVLADLDNTSPSHMDSMFYMQAYDDLHMHLEELLTAVDETGHAKGDADAGPR